MARIDLISAWIAATVLMSAAMAGDLRSPIDVESAAVLPKGVRNPRFKVFFTNVEERFSGVGDVEPLGLKLNKNVTWTDVLDGQKSQSDREKVQLILQELGYKDNNASAGQTTGVINSYANVKIPVFAMGISDDLTLALAAPVVSIDISTDTGFYKTAQGQAFVNKAASKSEWSGNEAMEKINDGVQRKLVENGYEPLKNQSGTHLGDIQLVSKYRLSQLSDDQQSWLVKGTLVAPTGHVASPDRIADVSSGDGQWDVGATLVYDRKLLEDLKINAFAGYLAQLPDSTVKRIPEKQDSSLTPDKEQVSRDLGDQVSLGSSLTYEHPGTGLSVSPGYSLQYMSGAKFDGKRFAPVRYQWLSEQTPSQTLHSFVISAGFSTVNFYRKKQFVYPFEVKLIYSKPFAGRNAGSDSLYAGELVMFF